MICLKCWWFLVLTSLAAFLSVMVDQGRIVAQFVEVGSAYHRGRFHSPVQQGIFLSVSFQCRLFYGACTVLMCNRKH